MCYNSSTGFLLWWSTVIRTSYFIQVTCWQFVVLILDKTRSFLFSQSSLPISPRTPHLQALKRILRFLKGTSNHGIHITKGTSTLTTYCDTNWAGSHKDRRSTSGYCVYFGSTPISWSAKKQPTFTRNYTEEEYRALAITSAEIT